MKDNDKLIAVLSTLLTDKLTTVNLFMVHSEMCDNLGYSILHKAIRKMAMDQMLLAEWLIERISFLDGSSVLSNLNATMISKTVLELITKNNSLETDTSHAYNDAIELAREVDDRDTAELLARILKVEEGYVDWAEIQREHIRQKGMQNYLITQTESMAN